MMNETMNMGCRICWQSKGMMLSPCDCKGMLQHVHEDCLQSWISSIMRKHPQRIIASKEGSKRLKCELCHSYITFFDCQESRIVCRPLEEMKNNGDYECLIGLLVLLLIWEVFSLGIIIYLAVHQTADTLTILILVLIMLVPFPFISCFLLKRIKYTRIQLNGAGSSTISQHQLENIQMTQ